MIEALEARVAPAAVLHYIDVDGDKVTVTASKGTDENLRDAALFISPGHAVPGGQYLQILNLSAQSIFSGADLIVSVKRAPGGDGLANVGYIDATGADNGQDLLLGKVSVSGDLGRIAAGNGSGVGLKSLSVYSLGMLGSSTPGVGGGLGSEIKGSLGALTIATDMGPGYVAARGGDLLSVKVGGSIHGGDDRSAGEIFAEGNLGPVTIGGDIIGGAGFFSGAIAANGKVTSVTIGGSLIGGAGESSGSVTSGFNGAADLGPVKVGHDVTGGAGANSGAIASMTAGGSIVSVTIGGSLSGAAGESSGSISATANGSTGGKIGPISIKGNITGGTTSFAGSINAQGDVTSLAIGGSVVGGSGEFSGGVKLGGGITKILSIGGSLIGGSKNAAGSILINGAAHDVKIGGSVLGGSGTQTGFIFCVEATSFSIGGSLRGGGGSPSGSISVGLGTVATKVSIAGDIQGGSNSGSGVLFTGGAFGAVIVGGDVRGGSELRTGAIHATTGLRTLVVGGSLFGGSGASTVAMSNDDGSGSVIVDGGTVTSIRIGDSVVGGASDYSGVVAGAGNVTLGMISIGGDCLGGAGVASGGVVCGLAGLGSVKSVSIGGSLVGGVASQTGFIIGSNIQSISIGGSFVGGSRLSGGSPLQNSGYIFSSGPIESLTIVGSIVAGNTDVSGTIFDSARIEAGQDIGPIVVKGNITGNEHAVVVIQSGSAANATPTRDVGLASLTVGGSVTRALILSFGTGNEQIGAVSVKHDWVASSLVAGVTVGDGYYGNDNDTVGLAGSIARIASISIGGKVAGSPTASEHYGFSSHEIGAFKIGGVALKLAPGQGNDVIELAPESGNISIRETIEGVV